MSDWTSGYRTDVPYTFGYYGELNPFNAQLAFLNAGLKFPENGAACELGYGQGLSVNFHAAGSQVHWHGTDFNPSHAAFARELAGVSGASVALSDDSFEEFCSRADLPEFDYIGLHGIWSWVSAANREILVNFFRRKLKVGGVLYISYNTLPGWAPMLPMRYLMAEHAKAMSPAGAGATKQVEDALEFVDALLATNPAYARAEPGVVGRMKAIRAQNKHYVAHEYFNDEWQPMHFSEMTRSLKAAKLEFACSANYFDHVDVLSLTTEQQAFLQKIEDRTLRECVRDFMTNQQFRKDYWVRGAQRIAGIEQTEALRKQRVLLVRAADSVVKRVNSIAGEVTLAPAVYDPLLAELADHVPHTFGQLEAALQPKGVNLSQLLQAVMVMVGKGDVMCVKPQDPSAEVVAQCRKVNAHLQQKARSNSDVNYLLSPQTGGGIAVGRIHQLFLGAREQGKKKPGDWAVGAWEVLSAQGLKLVKDGKELASKTENVAELNRQANEFEKQALPILRGLGIAA